MRCLASNQAALSPFSRRFLAEFLLHRHDLKDDLVIYFMSIFERFWVLFR